MNNPTIAPTTPPIATAVTIVCRNVTLSLSLNSPTRPPEVRSIPATNPATPVSNPAPPQASRRFASTAPR
jgi:hypothetical protein